MSTKRIGSKRQARTRSAQSKPRTIAVIDSDLGWVAAAWIAGRVARLSFAHRSPGAAWAAIDWMDVLPSDPTPAMRSLLTRIQKFAAGSCDDFLDVAVDLPGATPFQQAIIERCRRIPYGGTLSYGQLAEQSGYPRAARAAGNVMRANRIPLIIPCHRVVGAAGSLGGYSAPQGLAMKRRLLALEEAAEITV